MFVQRASERDGVPWRNGMGVQYEIISDGNDDWTWRVATADITHSVPFSLFSGIRREFCVADGNGVTLTINGVENRCGPGSVTVFRGDDVVAASLLDGPIQALNLMRRGGGTMTLQIATPTAAVRCQVIVAIMGPASVEIANQVVELELLDAIIDLNGMDAVARMGKVAVL